MRKLTTVTSILGVLCFLSCSKEVVNYKNQLEKTSQSQKDLPNLNLTGENAAPSQHIYFNFNKDAVLKMHKIKITNTAKAEYFSVHNYDGGYAGLQDPADPKYNTSNILIASLWDKNTAAANYAFYSYIDSKTIASRFGGEGDGQKTINPYDWKINNWYNVVLRSWKENGKIYIANFIQDLSTGKWFHTSTIGREAGTGFLGKSNDAFLENWTGNNSSYDGRYHRKALFKDCWNLAEDNTWEKSTSRSFSANANDAARNGAFDRAFNAGYDTTEDALFMEHGGSTTPNSGFGTGRTLALPAQTNQGTNPVLTTVENTFASAKYVNNKLIVSWGINDTKSPQLSYKIEILNNSGAVIQTVEKIKPEKRADTLSNTLTTGSYTVILSIKDIFNQSATAKSIPFSVINSTDIYKIKNVSSGKYLGILNNSTANSAQVVQQSSTTNNAQKWKIIATANGYNLINLASNKSIDVPNSTDNANTGLIQYQSGSGANQQWFINFLETANNIYIQSALSKGLIIDNPGSSANENTQVVLYSINNNTGTPNQRWILEKQ